MKHDDLKKKADELGVTPEVYLFLRQSNRKIRYFTYDLKTEKIIIDGERVTIIPEREDSLERLGEQGYSFAAEEESVEDRVIAVVLREQLRDALKLLDADERSLIENLFFSDQTEEEVSVILGITQQTVSYRKKILVDKIKKLMKI